MENNQITKTIQVSDELFENLENLKATLINYTWDANINTQDVIYFLISQFYENNMWDWHDDCGCDWEWHSHSHGHWEWHWHWKWDWECCWWWNCWSNKKSSIILE